MNKVALEKSFTSLTHRFSANNANTCSQPDSPANPWKPPPLPAREEGGSENKGKNDSNSTQYATSSLPAWAAAAAAVMAASLGLRSASADRGPLPPGGGGGGAAASPEEALIRAADAAFSAALRSFGGPQTAHQRGAGQGAGARTGAGAATPRHSPSAAPPSPPLPLASAPCLACRRPSPLAPHLAQTAAQIARHAAPTGLSAVRSCVLTGTPGPWVQRGRRWCVGCRRRT
jgi:hypothetical protein